jgi:hypothetical protein
VEIKNNGVTAPAFTVKAPTTSSDGMIKFANTTTGDGANRIQLSSNNSFYGFGVNGSTLNYVAWTTHKFTFSSSHSNSVEIYNTGVTAPAFFSNSDYRLKDQIQTLSGSFYTVDNIRPVHYILKDSQMHQMGFIAHEIQEHFPTIVSGEKDGEKMQSVNYSQLIPVLVKEIQEAKSREKKKDKEIEDLKTGMSSLHQEFTRMYQHMRNLEEKIGRFSLN